MNLPIYSPWKCFLLDCGREAHSSRYGWLSIWLHPQPYLYFRIRIDQQGHQISGTFWSVIRLLLYPVFFLIRIGTGCHLEISFQARIGRGMRIFHPSLGCVIHSRVVVGKNLTLFGGNSLGMKRFEKDDLLIIGDNVSFGIHAVALGPLVIGDGAAIGANATATKHNFLPGEVIVNETRRI